MTQNKERNPDEIERDIEHTRAELAETLTTLGRRFSPNVLVDQGAYLLRDHGPELGRRLGTAIKRNPLPAVLIGVGLLWLAFSGSRLGSRRDYARSDFERGIPQPNGGGALMAVSRENLTAWLRDAHAMESQAIEILEKQASWIKNYPERERRCAIIWRNPSAQAERLEQCLERLGTDTSAIKTGLGKAIGTAQQLSGLFASDEVVKSGIAHYAFEHYEIACYRALIGAATEAAPRARARSAPGSWRGPARLRCRQERALKLEPVRRCPAALRGTRSGPGSDRGRGAARRACAPAR
jgi:ferritin-like metal-binding protein YciE